MRPRPHLLLASLLVTGCAVGVSSGDGPATMDAEILALSTYEASLGTSIEMYGTAFPTVEAGELIAIFEGQYNHDAGGFEDVVVEAPVRRVDPGTVRWGGFGPYRIPFGVSGEQTGMFVGTVHLRLVTPDGEVIDGAARTPIELRVLPSILVRDLQPTVARCGAPAVRAIGGVPYQLRVQAVGFEPVSFTYTLSAPALGVQPEAVRHLATGATDSLGADGSFVLPDVPEDVQAYGAIISVEARAADGSSRRSLFAIGVHRPIEVFYNGNVAVAEIFAPTPVSACIPGGEAGRSVSYTETMSETRSRGYSVNWNETWLTSQTHSTSRSSSETVSEQNSVSFSTTDGSSWHWNVGASTEFSGGGTLFGIIEAGMKVGFNGEYGQEYNHSTTQGTSRTTGLSRTETTTDTRSTTESEGGSEGEAFDWQVSSSEQLARGFSGDVIAGTYGVFYRQSVRLVRHAALVTYNLCGAAEVVGEVDFQDWTWSTDLALGNACPPLPASNLPEASCVLEPCQGE
jgi:hypothetical protein